MLKRLRPNTPPRNWPRIFPGDLQLDWKQAQELIGTPAGRRWGAAPPPPEGARLGYVRKLMEELADG